MESQTNTDNLNVFRLLRIARDYTRKDLAERLLITQAYVASIERGDKYPSERLLKDYARVMNVSVEFIKNYIPDKYSGFEDALSSILQVLCSSNSYTTK